MNKKALSLAICVAMALPTVSSALSLGEIQSNSSLNQPFRGQINLLSTSVADARNLRIRIASPDVFNRVGIDRPAFLNGIRFKTTVRNGRPIILVSSNQPIHEPFLNFLLEVSWPNGQLLKEYTVLLDPPVLMRPDTAIASNAAGVRAEPRSQGRITRPAVQRQQPRRATQQPRRVVHAVAPARRVAPQQQRRVASVQRRASSYRVRRGDTLTKIAGKLGYRGIRSEQMMVALFEKNRRAFTRNNMNNLKAGVVLSRPSLQEARVVTSKQAKSQIIAQARDWKKARATALAKSNSKKGIKVASNDQARITVSGNNSSVNSNAQSGAGGNAQSADLRKQLTMINESLTTKKKENEELKSRVSELESLLRKKNRLITLKSEQLTVLQERMGVTGGEVPNNAVTPINQNDGTNIQQQVANERANQNGEIIRANSGANSPEQLAMSDGSQGTASVVEDPIVTPEPIVNTEPELVTNQADPFVKKEAEESMDIMGLLGSPLAMGVGGGSLLALLGGLWFMRRRKNNKYEEFEFSGDNAINIDDAEEVETSFNNSNLADESMSEDTFEVDASEFVEHDEMRQEHIKNSGLLSDDQEDLLQEADVYIVYGLHDQAESELKQAIDKEPENLAYRAKLLENYKAAGNKEAFEIEAKTFMQLEVDGKEKYLDDISEWGLALAPESKLFTSDGLKAAATASGVAMVAGTAVAKGTDADDDITQDLDSLINEESSSDISNEHLIDDDFDSFDLDDILAEDTHELEDGLSSSLDLDDVDSVGEVQQDFTANLTGDDGDLDLSFDIKEDTSDKVSTLDGDMGNDIDLSGALEFDDDFEFDSELDELTDSLSADNTLDINGSPEINGRLDLDSLNLDDKLDVTSLNLDLDSNDLNKIMPNEHQYKAPAIDGLSDNKVEDNLLAEFDDNLSFLDLDNDDSNGMEETQIDTKLDLAKAYIDMGDIEGARSTLEEVMLEGSDDQKKEAEDLLHQTG